MTELSHGAAEKQACNKYSVILSHSQRRTHSYRYIYGGEYGGQDVLSVCLKQVLGGPQFSQLGVMTGLWVWFGLYVLKRIWCDGNKCVLFLLVLIRHPLFLLTLSCLCLHIEWNAFCEVFR